MDKSKPERVRASIFLPKGLWLALKLAAVREGSKPSELVVKACEKYIRKVPT